MGKHRNLGSNSNVVDENEAEQNADVSDFSEEADGIAIPAEQSSPCPDNFAQPPPKKKTKGKTSMITDVAGPMIEFLKSRTSVAKTEMTQSHNSKFLESLVPDMDKLTPRRQRQFKEKVLTTLNRFLDEQEEEAVWLSRNPQCTTTLAPSPQYVNSPSPQQLINSPSPQHLINTGIESVQQPVLSTPQFSQQNCQDNTTWNNLLLTKELDKHGDNFRSLPLTIAIEEDIKPQVLTQAASLPALGRPRTSNSTSSSSKRQAKRERPDHDQNTTTSATAATATTTTTSSSSGISNPKRSTGAFLQFCLDQREATQTQFQQQHGQQLDKKGLTKLLSIRWNKLSDDEKKIYIEKYEIAREEMNIKQEQ